VCVCVCVRACACIYLYQYSEQQQQQTTENGLVFFFKFSFGVALSHCNALDFRFSISRVVCIGEKETKNTCSSCCLSISFSFSYAHNFPCCLHLLLLSISVSLSFFLSHSLFSLSMNKRALRVIRKSTQLVLVVILPMLLRRSFFFIMTNKQKNARVNNGTRIDRQQRRLYTHIYHCCGPRAVRRRVQKRRQVPHTCE